MNFEWILHNKHIFTIEKQYAAVYYMLHSGCFIKNSIRVWQNAVVIT